MNWPLVKLKQVTTKVGSGATPRGGDAVYVPSGVPLIRSMNVHFDGFRDKGLVFIDQDAAAELNNVTVETDDVLFNITGASIGRVTTAPGRMAGARVNQHVCILRTTETLLPKFLAYYMATPGQQALINSNQIGGTRQAMTRGMLLQWNVPVPARLEQRRIVELLEQADKLRRQRFETDELAARILPSLFYEMFGDPATNPKGWPRVKLNSIIADTRNGLYKHADFYGRGTHILKMFNIVDGDWNFDRVDRVEVTADELKDYGLEPGDLLVNRVNTPELVGKCAVIPRELGEAVFESKNIRVRLNREEAEPDYISHFLNTSFGHAALCQGVKHAIGMATINNSDLRNCQLPLPPVAIQAEWARHVAASRALNEQTKTSALKLEALFRTLLHQAFNGELTAKWRQAHLKELLAEMEHQARLLRAATDNNYPPLLCPLVFTISPES